MGTGIRSSEAVGISVIRTSEKKKTLSAADCVRTYNSLLQVEQAFCCLEGVALQMRPIRHRVDPRVRPPLPLCLLAYYVEWQMHQVLAPLLYADEELEEDHWGRGPVKPAQASESAKAKKKTHETATGLPVHSGGTLLAHLANRGRNIYQLVSDSREATFEQVREPNAVQRFTAPAIRPGCPRDRAKRRETGGGFSSSWAT